jgi:hypothetical protein
MPEPSGSRVLLEEAGFRYSIATEEQRDQIVRVLSESFSREPMAAALRASASDLAPLIERFVPECTRNGLSVVAAPATEPETVAGVFISRDFKSPLPAGVPEEFPWFLPIGQALRTVGEAYEAQRPELAVGDAVDLWMVGVAEARFARRGLASGLFRACASVARDRGFARCVTECTGNYSQAAARRIGSSASRGSRCSPTWPRRTRIWLSTSESCDASSAAFARRAACAKEAQALGRHADRRAPRVVGAGHEPAVARLLPHGETRTGSAPRFEDLGVVALLQPNPLEEVQDQ